MEGKRFIQSIRLQNILSFGPDTKEFRLEPLNVLIGPNGSGKSNFIDCLGLLMGAARNLGEALKMGGSSHDWMWKGNPCSPLFSIQATFEYPYGDIPLRYYLSMYKSGPFLSIFEESLQYAQSTLGIEEPEWIYHKKEADAWKRSLTEPSDLPVKPGAGRKTVKCFFDIERSVLSAHGNVDTSTSNDPEIDYPARALRGSRTYRDWQIGPRAEIRRPQAVNVSESFLSEDAGNLALVLNHLRDKGILPEIIKRMTKFNESIEDITTRLYGGSIQLCIREKGLGESVAAIRLSDGTLRYLCLLAVLCHPEPPPLICIEEPELGMHPDMIKSVAELLVEASQRTQLVVTTHSDILISALHDCPESIVVCENHGNGTEMRRLDPEKMREWLKDYTLDELWRMGEIGGNRW